MLMQAFLNSAKLKKMVSIHLGISLLLLVHPHDTTTHRFPSVAELKTSLSAKTIELREKEALANSKLQQMVADQNEAQKRKEEADSRSVDVDRQQVAIAERKEKAQSELDEAEPALNSAKSSVKGIKKRDLDEIRNLSRPPVNVKLTLECVAIMLGEKSVEWADVRKLLAKSDFIPNILEFDGA